jgi:predicted nucleic acid-binding protein
VSNLPQFIIDASVVAKLYTNEPLSDETRTLLGHYIQGKFLPSLVAPDLIYVECANTLWKKVYQGSHTAAQASSAISDLLALSLTIVTLVNVIQLAVDIACSYRSSAYDSCYVALSDQRGIPLVTADEKMVNRFAGSPFQVVALADYLNQLGITA